MDALAVLSFRSRELLWLLAALPLVGVALWMRERTRQRYANRFASERLRGVSNPIRSVRPWLLLLAFASGVLALAGPRFGFVLRTVEEPESNRVILLDTSQSMAAEDVGTSRLDAAKAVAKKILENDEGRVALILFEGEAEVASPLTSDRDAVVTLMESFGAGELTEPGSDVGRALRRAMQLLPAGAAGASEFIVISDGEHRGSDIDPAVDEVAAAGITVSSVLVGTEQGAGIPTGGGEFLRDEGGQTVLTTARSEILREIAERTGGDFFDNPFGVIPLRQLAGAMDRAEQTGGRATRVPVERYQWPLGFALAMLVGASIAHRGAEC